jgi:GTPase KRas protein
MVDKRTENEYKIALIGSTGVGKSSLCLQFARNRFSERYEPTIEDYYRKVAMQDGKPLVFDIIDTAGQEGNLTNLDQLIRQASGFIMVYDITQLQSFKEVQHFYDRVLHVKNKSHLPMVLVANKCDMTEQRKISQDQGIALGQKWDCKFWEVSAKNKINLETVFYECAKIIRQNEVDGISNKTCSCVLL